MEIYLVGGAIRNRLLGLPVTEKDYVVVGSTPDEMLSLGYVAVGRDFPVYLHPKTKAEYALARTERKKGPGHKGFDCETEAVTLAQDLSRRDLTINAIAESTDGTLIDPLGGLDDIKAKCLRHISDAFAEDPLRVLRVARFAALLHPLEFQIHDATLALMRQMIDRGEISELTPERIVMEIEKALATDAPHVFFEVLQATGANRVLWPQVNDDGIRRLTSMAQRTTQPASRFAALIAHLSSDQARELAASLRLPNKLSELAQLVAAHAVTWRTLPSLAAQDIVALLYTVDAFRRPERFFDLNELLGELAMIDGISDAASIIAQWVSCFELAREVTASSITTDVSGAALGLAIKESQIAQVAKAKVS